MNDFDPNEPLSKAVGGVPVTPNWPGCPEEELIELSVYFHQRHVGKVADEARALARSKRQLAKARRAVRQNSP